MSGVDGNSKEEESVYERSPAQNRSGCYPRYERYGPSWRRCAAPFSCCFLGPPNEQPTTPDRPGSNVLTNHLPPYTWNDKHPAHLPVIKRQHPFCGKVDGNGPNCTHPLTHDMSDVDGNVSFCQ